MRAILGVTPFVLYLECRQGFFKLSKRLSKVSYINVQFIYVLCISYVIVVEGSEVSYNCYL